MFNPLREIDTALWNLLIADPDFAALVPKGNRIKYEDERDRNKPQPEKENIAPADTPEVRIIPLGYRANLFADSAQSQITAKWAIQIATGRQKTKHLYDVIWSIIRAMSRWDETMANLEWMGTTYVKSCRALESQSTLDDRRANRGLRGWSTVWMGETDCWFTRSSLSEG